MKTKHIWAHERQPAGRPIPKLKTVGLQFGVTDGDLAARVKAAFDLAKSAGRELNLTFSADGARQSDSRQLQLQ